MISKNELKRSCHDGQIITEKFLHDLIDSSHFEVSRVRYVDLERGIEMAYVNSGPIFQFWMDGTLLEDWELRMNRDELLFSRSQIPELSFYPGQSSPAQLISANIPGSGILPVGYIRLDNENVYLHSLIEATLPRGSQLIFNELLILGIL